jgi:PKD repeat protein
MMNRFAVLLGLLLGLWALPARAQITAIDDSFDEDPCASGDWVCLGNTRWIDPLFPLCDDPNNPSNPDCNLYDPGEGYVLVTRAVGNQNGNMFRTEQIEWNNFRLTAVVELRDGSIGRPADGMAIVVVGGNNPPPLGCAGGSLGVGGLGSSPTMFFEFDNWDCNPPGDNGVSGTGPPDDNHVAFGYSPTGFDCNGLPAHAFAHVPVLLNNKQPPPSPPNRFLFQVQVKNGLVTCDIANPDAGMPKTRMYTYQIPNFEPFSGFLGVTGSTGGAWQNQILHSIKIDDITGICLFAPAEGRRRVTNLSRTDKLPVYSQGDNLKVAIELTNIRQPSPADDCDIPTELTISETLPATWTAASISDGGTFAGGVVTWVLKGAAVKARTLTYTTVALTGDPRAIFSGIMQETNVANVDPFGIGGDLGAILDTPTKDGFITQWLLLGPYGQLGSDTPGSLNLERDYLTDGAAIDEFSVLPKDGDTVNTNFSVAGSTSYQNGVFTTPTWQSYAAQDLTALDTINLNTILSSTAQPDPSNVMAYALTYVNNTTGGDLNVNLDTASDDSIAVSIGRCSVLQKSIPRGMGTSETVEESTPVTLKPGVNRLLVKVFEGGGGWGFRLRFSDPGSGLPIEAPAIGLSLDPSANGGAHLDPDVGCPAAIISSPQLVGKAPFEAHLSGSKSFGRSGRAVTGYSWVFGDGNNGNGAEVVHTYANPGDYTVELTVTDAGGSTGTESRDVHVLAGGIALLGDGWDTVVPSGAGVFASTVEGIKTLHLPAGDDTTLQSGGDLAVEITALPPGETEFPVAVLLRNVGEHQTGLTIVQKTTGVTSALGFDTQSNNDPNAAPPFGVLARDNVPREDTLAADHIYRVQDPTVSDAYSPFTWVPTSEAKLKLQLGINILHLDNRRTPSGPADNGNQVAAIVFGGDSVGLTGRVLACPVTPTGLKPTANPFCQISLDWADNPGQVQGYNVYRAAAAAGPYTKIASLLPTSDYLDTGLAAATTYYYKVSASLPECESQLTAQRNAKTPATCQVPVAPDPPLALNAVGGDKQETLTWSAPTTGPAPTGYAVYRSDTPGGPYTKKADTAATVLTYTDTGLADSTSYCYVVRSKNSTLESVNSNEDCDKTAGVGGGPTFRRGDVDSNGVVEITDAVKLLGYLFLGGGTPECLEAGDTDNNGNIDITDAVTNLGYQFLGQAPPAAPGPLNCGPDPADPMLGCTKGCQ